MFNLEQELKKYIPYNEDEKINVQKTLQFLLTNSNCYDRSNLFGHISASAFVVDREGNILLNQHKIINMWFQFGGHCDGETDCISVAKRELMEESGIENCEIYQNSIFDVDCHIIPANPNKNEPEHYHYDIRFLFITNQKNFKITHESNNIKWFTIDEAFKVVDKQDIGICRMITKYKNMYLQNLL